MLPRAADFDEFFAHNFSNQTIEKLTGNLTGSKAERRKRVSVTRRAS
jgi:hypothetical protein